MLTKGRKKKGTLFASCLIALLLLFATVANNDGWFRDREVVGKDPGVLLRDL